MELERWVGRVALVTGAASGLGAAIAEELVRAGMQVVGLDLTLQPLQELSQRLGSERGKLWPQQGDVTKEGDLQRVFRWLDDNLGGVSVLINNAGKGVLGRTEDLDLEAAAALININVMAVISVASKTIQSMKKHNILDGHIVNMSSIAGQLATVNSATLQRVPMGVYCASKSAVTTMSRVLRAELMGLHPEGFRTRVTNLCPGFVRTPMASSLIENLNRILQPCDVVRAVRFVLASPPEVEIAEITIHAVGGGL